VVAIPSGLVSAGVILGSRAKGQGSQNGNPKRQATNPKVSTPKVADAIRRSLDILRLCLGVLGFGIWNLRQVLKHLRASG
jgi:hypothetical protein